MTQEVSGNPHVHQRGNTEQSDPAYGTHIIQVPKLTGNPTTTSPATLRRYVTNQPKEEPPDRYDYTTPSHYNTHPPTYPGANQATMDFAKFFARHELITKGLIKFNDRPEGFRAWRSSFQNTIRDLSYSEEIELLIKYLGTESAEHAKRIRVININHPETGLKMIWHRLNECYGSAEVIENALFKRIDDFPKISNKGYQKLRELSDLLMELQVAKAEGDLPGLAFLDTAIVQKLPYNLQERWMAHGSKFKQTYNVTFPPFTVFVDFVYQQAKMRNYPSFDLTLPHATPLVPNTRKAVHKTVHKTNVSSSGSFHRSADSSQEETNNKDPGKQCPLHQRPHPLLKCRAFRGKSIDDRKAFLKENHICYKCCSSTSHLAKDCKVSVKCTECDSTHHNTALHPGPAPWTLPHNKGASERGGEEGDTATTTPEVTSQCTEVCKGAIGGRSCSKICLVKVHPEGQRDKAIRLYAIMDNQSNGSLACPAFFDLFNIKGPSIPYSLKTCAGVIETAGRKASGYQVESIDGQICLPLPPITECSRIPDNRTEIPTPDAALHLKCIMHLIPELDPKAQIMLLLGRDILWVHKARDQINGPHNAPYAQKLDLGWVSFPLP
ncbi:hypothetical protein XENTR_v10005572 [Xenopus tropicalis]|nr:hypothetical protein XENTR_v10005572 [Xenopus tropicalis]